MKRVDIFRPNKGILFDKPFYADDFHVRFQTQGDTSFALGYIIKAFQAVFVVVYHHSSKKMYIKSSFTKERNPDIEM